MFAVLFLPDFLLQAALRHDPTLWTRPVALVDPAVTPPRIIAATPPARAAGVIDGMTPPQVLARCRDAAIRHRSTAAEAATREAVLQVAFGFSPHLENTSSGLVTLDLRGLSELTDPGRQPAWAARLQAAVTALGLRVRIGVGATPNLARQAALWSDGIQVVGEAGEFIANLPVAALDPTPHVAAILQQWGIRTVGEFLALGQGELAERFGLEALALFAAASSTVCRPLHLVRPAERFEESWDFEYEVETVEPLLFLLRRFVEAFGQRLEALGLAAEQLILRLRLESGPTAEYRLRLPEPTRQPDALFRALQTHLETVRTESPVVGITLTAEPGRPRQRQFSLFEAAVRDPHQFQETLARLSALVGPDRVGTPVRENSHRPDAFRLVPPDFDQAPLTDGQPVSDLHAVTPWRRLRPGRPARVELRNRRKANPSEVLSVGRPAAPLSLRLSDEQEARILSPTFRKDPRPESPSSASAPVPKPPPRPPEISAVPGQPVGLHSSVTSGRIHEVRGPWRTSGHWWEPAAWDYVEWDVETEGGECVRIRGQSGGWTVEAVGD